MTECGLLLLLRGERREAMQESRGKKARTKSIIVNAVKDLIEKNGLRHITFNAIAEEADMCRTTIFNHYSTINELMLSVIEQEIADVIVHCKDSGEEGVDLVRGMFEKIIDDACKYPKTMIRLLPSVVISDTQRGNAKKLKAMIFENLPDMSEEAKEEVVIKLSGYFYGMIFQAALDEIKFDRRKMRRMFNEYVTEILEA